MLPGGPGTPNPPSYYHTFSKYLPRVLVGTGVAGLTTFVASEADKRMSSRIKSLMFRSSRAAKTSRVRGGQAALRAYKVAKGRPALNRAYGSVNRRTGGFAGIEKKFFDTTVSALAFASTWTAMQPSAPAAVDCISAPAVGTAENQHIGRTFIMRSVFVRFQVTLPGVEAQGTPPPDVVYRIIVVMDTQTNGAVVPATSVVKTTTNDTQAFRNLQESTRFNILWDTGRRVLRPHNLNDGAIDKFSAGTMDHVLNFNHVFKSPIKVRTIGTTAVIGSIADYSISIIAIASSTLLDLAYTSRMRYSEL